VVDAGLAPTHLGGPRLPKVLIVAISVVALLAVAGAAMWARRAARLAERRTAEVRALVDQLPGVAYRVGLDGRCLYISPRLRELTGWDPGDVIGRNLLGWFAERLHPEDRDRVVARATELRHLGSGSTGPFRAGHADGSYQWYELEFLTTSDARGSGVRQGLVRNISRRIEAERRYQTLVEQAPAVVSVIDLDSGTAELVSARSSEITGVPADYWLAAGPHREWRERIQPGTGRVSDWRERVLRGEPVVDRYQWRRPDGRLVWLRSHMAPLPTAPGRVQTVVFDVTEEEEMRRLYQRLVEDMPAAVLKVDMRDGRFLFASPQLEALTGISPSSWTGAGGGLQTFAARVTAGQVPAPDWQELFGRGTTCVNEFRWRRPDGRERWFRSTSSPIADTPDTSLTLLTDVTELREAQERLAAAEQRSRAALAALVRTGEEERQRIASELHDDTVQVMAALLLTPQAMSAAHPDLRRFEAMMAGALERTRSLMFELRPQILETAGLEAAIGSVAADGPWQEAVVDVDVRRQSPTTEALAYRTIRELIVNARKHSNARRLGVRGREDGATLVFDVEDDGVGFDVERALDPSTRRGHLGLDTAHERLRLAQGELAIDSAPGRGARFHITLPSDPRTGSSAAAAEMAAPAG
jgi:PAS domain S-box-containing protein